MTSRGFGFRVVVVEARACRRIAAESEASKFGMATAARFHIDNPHLEHIARFGIIHKDGAGQI